MDKALKANSKFGIKIDQLFSNPVAEQDFY